MNYQEVVQYYKDKIKWTTEPDRHPGGQSCGIPPRSVTLVCEELDIKITIGSERSQIRNKEMAYLLFELYLSEKFG